MPVEAVTCSETNRSHIRVTQACNSKCMFCLTDFHGSKFSHPPAELVMREIEKARLLGVERVIFSGGEPTINPSFLDAINYASDQGFEITLKTQRKR